LIVQIIYLSIDYFSYPFGIKVYIDYGEKISLPSITLCTERDFIWSEKKLEDLNSGLRRDIIKHFDPDKQCKLAFYYRLKLNNSEEQREKVNIEKNSNFLYNKIINSNDPNISLKNIFANTLSVDDLTECRINYKFFKDQYREIDCLSKSRVIEIFKKENRFGKCFAFFNRKEIVSELSEKIDLSRDGYIQFQIYKNAYKIKSSIENYESQSIYLSVHSSNSSTTISNFNQMTFAKLPLTLLEPIITFNKIIYKKLPKPYSTECQDYSQDSKFHSYQDCFEFCSLKHTISVNNCVPNPIENDFVDLKNNSDFQNSILCNKTHVRTKNNQICKIKCRRNCFEDYYNSKIETSRQTRREYTDDIYQKIRIIARNHPINLIKKNVYLFRIYVYLNRIVIMLQKFQRFEWKKLIELICICCYLYQLYELTTEYLTYGSTVHVQFSSYKDSFGYLKAENIPGVSICAKNFFNTDMQWLVSANNRECFRDLMNHFDSIKKKKKFSCILNCNYKIHITYEYEKQCFDNITKMIDEERNISNYLMLLNYLPAELKCEIKYLTLCADNVDCLEKENLVFSKSNLGTCFTYLSNLTKTGINDVKFDISKASERLLGVLLLPDKNYWHSIHDQNQLPSFVFIERMNSKKLEYTKTKVIRLPHPFSTNCFDYKNGYHVKSRGQCMNQCLIDKSIKNKGCVPKDFQYLTLSNIDFLNAKFCENSSFEINLKTECSKYCHLACEESFFSYIQPNKERLLTKNGGKPYTRGSAEQKLIK